MLTRSILHPALPIDPFLLSLDDDYCRRVFLAATEGREPGKSTPRFAPAQERAYQAWIGELFMVAAEDGWETCNTPADFDARERSAAPIADADSAFAAVPASDDEWAAHILDTTFSAAAWLAAASA